MSKELAKNILTDLFDWEHTPEGDDAEAFLYLCDHIAWLLEHNKDFLMSLMYRLDVLEPKINKALSPGNPIPPHIAIAQLIIERQKERIATKRQYSPPKQSDPDIDSW